MLLWFLFAISSAVVFGLAGLFMKISQMRGGASNSLLLGLYAAGTCGFWGQALLTRSWDPWNVRIWIAGAIIGLGSAWGNLLFMKALDHGPASLTSPLTNGNILLVILMGAIWFDEPLRPLSILGVSCLLIAVVLLAIRSENSLTVKDNRWYAYVFFAMLLFCFRNGGLKITDSLDLDNTSVLWSGYFLSWIWFALASRKQSNQGQASESSIRTGLLWGLAAGVCSYGGLQLYSAALSDGPSHLVAPIFATNGLVVALGSVLLYRERLSILQWGAFLFLMLGLVLVRV